MRRLVPASILGALCVLGVACGGSGNGGGGGSGGGGTGSGGASAALYEPCSVASRVGGFSVKLVADTQTTTVAGGVRAAVLPADVWQQVATGGDCRLIVGPTLTCTPACVNPQVCAGQNQCIDEPRFRDVGAVTVTGVGASTLMPALIASNNNYYASVETPYPPAAAGANIGLQVAGGDLAGFSLMGRGVSELQVPTTPLTVMGGQAFSFAWTAPAQPGAARISASLDIAHHGGVAARIECELDDDGTGEIPAALIDQLISRGTAGFPELFLIRRTIDSTSIAAGCVDFQVASEQATLVELCTSPGVCVRSCDAGTPCPSGQTCRGDRTCG